MFCPECGSEAGEAKFCPECGNDLAEVRKVQKKGPSAPTTGSAGTSKAGAAGEAASAPAQSRETASRGKTAVYLWGVIAVIAIVVVAVVLFSKGSGDEATPAVGGGQPPALNEVSTSGSYDELVTRGNDYYDQGAPYIENGDPIGGAAWFAAAAKAYGAAWAKQADDPAVGTDYATSIFYSGDVEGAVKQIEKVIAIAPAFQNARFNHGNYLVHQARILEQQGKKKQANVLYARAKAEYAVAVKIDPGSDSGQAAAAALKKL